jgi:SH3-like domain-containing protein
VQSLARKILNLGAWLGLGIIGVGTVSDGLAQTRPQPRPQMTEVPAPQPQQTPAPAPVTKALPTKGAVTNLPIPRYVTLKGAEGNARRGPGLTHRIDWVFTTSGTPLRVTAEFENWRRVEDFEGMGGWVHFTLLSGVRGLIVTKDMAEFHVLPDLASPVVFQAEAGALARILSCTTDWCRVRAGSERGWAPKSIFWGVDPEEVIE